MEIETIGAWILLGVGALLLLLGAVMALKGLTKPVFITYFTGFALSGLGVFGINFINHQSPWITAIVEVVLAETAQTAEAAFDRLVELVGSGSGTDRERAAFATLLPMYLTSDVVPDGFSVNDALLAVDRVRLDPETPPEAQATLQFVADNVRLELAQKDQFAWTLAPGATPEAVEAASEIEQLIAAQSNLRFDPSAYDVTTLDPLRAVRFEFRDLSPAVLEQLNQYRFGVGPP